ncbi:hypothetical protein PQX77_008050 [Marasmius sp. AFHP31]|nr:hypothetical protein PQX77_008050 [Marasmius sp. AFHP31]
MEQLQTTYKNSEMKIPGSMDIREHAAAPRTATVASLLLTLLLTVGCFRVIADPLHVWDPILGTREQNGIHTFFHLDEHCADIPPIQAAEFAQRQEKLVQALRDSNASAYIAEPSASAIYFANVSATQWHLSERPFLFVFTPDVEGGSVQPNLTILAPKFEETRAKQLSLPFEGVHFIVWPEEQSPYEVLFSSLNLPAGNIFIDGATRFFIVDGLQKAYKEGEVLIAPSEVTRLRERKSANEVTLMKCANEATLLALREVHKQMRIGMRESEARDMIASALTAIGLEEGSCLTLFGEDAALPHGGGSDRVLGKSDYALFDCVASLHGYKSDLTRTVALPDSDIPSNHSTIWQSVLSAQNAALAQARQGVVAKSVDEAARNSLASSQLDQFLTHRLGHGIGLENHESPYLNGGSEVILEPGHCFSDEPGVYIEGEVGVRLEDCFCIDEDGLPILLTKDVGGQALDPLSP